MPRSLLAVAISALLAVGFSACGNDNGAARPSGPLTKAEYERAFKDVVRSARRADSSTRGDSQQDQARVFISSLNRLVAGLDALQPPVEARQAHANFVAGMRGYIDYRRPAVAAIARGDEAEANRLLDILAPAALRERMLSARRFFDANGYDLATSVSLP